MWRRQCIDRLAGQRQIAWTAARGTGPAKDAPLVVDLMAGTGEIWPHVLRRIPSARITAIDISHRMHIEAVERLHGRLAHKIEHIEANALETALPDGIADLLVSTFGLKTFTSDQQRRLAGQVARLLRPGGAFALIEASDPKRWALRPIYRLYLDRVLPLIERLILRGAQDFSMIGTYTRNFGDCAIFEQALRDEGLVVSPRRHFFGCATSVAGIKPIAQAETGA